ncbi:hypothetical protein D6855_14260 [Butyrivibrio sp. CB08]|uniref:PcfJ domain-containing protein n=1 Tax=Butyrivibrio sp. CB08 TaxID=2364879 RepID=UPI000EA9EEE9|nr:PcfJ domain-containing protein [Butyrivibrio sp. CB08]RKM56828.1 hypothetical protein D6855_14260 [Butyrivibrio sp. CB08]
MLELKIGKNSWEPPKLDDEEVMRLIMKKVPLTKENHEQLLILRVRPYVDVLYVDYNYRGDEGIGRAERFVFRENYVWSSEREQLFVELCLDNVNCRYKYGLIDEIYDYYNELHPEWNLRRYYTDSIRVLDHIYHCMRKNSVKELLYKCNLDMLAKHSDDIDDLNLLASSPSEVYDGVPMKILRTLNCEVGGEMLCYDEYRKLFKALGRSYGEIYSQPLNDAQCGYIRHLHERELTPKEIGRIYLSRRSELSYLWHPRQFRDFLCKVQGTETLSDLAKIDPLYGKCLRIGEDDSEICEIQFYLLQGRETYNHSVRVSNRKRDYDWQERNHGYVVRYPQTINDFCRESVYMGNCLLGYVDAFINNATTIMFMRRVDDVNTPFITIEIYDGKLAQAYHRFNEDCTPEEAQWIRDYCKRHNIGLGQFEFNRELDLAE